MNYYDSIDTMPLFNWRQCQEHNAFQFMRINIEEADGRKVSEQKDVDAWEKLFQTYIDEFGWGKDFDRVMELKEEISLLQCDLIIKDERFILNRINMLKGELQDFLDMPTNGDMDTCIIHLSKWMGYRINERETTVRVFYKMLAEYDKEIEIMKKAS